MGWFRVLNSVVVLIGFLNSGTEKWSFSRLGTHCLENFFDMIRQNARVDDRFVCSVQIIAQTTLMLSSDQDNLGGAIIGTGLPTFSKEYMDLLTHSFLANAFLHFDVTGASDLMHHTGPIEVLIEWCQNDDHYKKDPGQNTDLSARITCYNIVARNLRGHRSGDAEDPS
jgi:hypothetical protein